MNRYEDEITTARAKAAVTHNLHLHVWLSKGSVCVTFESRLPSQLEGSYEYQAHWSFERAALADHDSLEDALEAVLADPPREWLALLVDSDGMAAERALWPEIAATVTNELVRDLRSEIDRAVQAILNDEDATD